MSEEVAVVIKASPEVAQAFMKLFPSAQIRKIKKPEEKPPEPQQQAAPEEEAKPVQASTPADREKLLREIMLFCQERKNHVDPVRFFNYYDGRGWMDAAGKKITDWKAKLIDWEKNGIVNKPRKFQTAQEYNAMKSTMLADRDLDKLLEDLDKI